MESVFKRRPEEVGISPSKIMQMLNLFDQKIHYPHGFMIAKNNTLISEGFWSPVGPEIPKNGYSLGKSLTAIAIGFAIDEGIISFETEVVPFFQDELPEDYDLRLEHLTVRNLLMMAASSAVASTTFADKPCDQWVRHYFSLIPHAWPGTEFHYDTGGMYLLSCLISKVTGRNTFSYLQEKLFRPLNITKGWWLEDGKGRNVGGWGIFLPIEDGLKIAETLVNDGRWDGKQVIPEWYVKELSQRKIDTKNDPHLGWSYGYSYGFWKGKESIFLAFGAFGQLWICDPDRKIVVIVSAGCSHEETKEILEIVQDTILLPAQEDALPFEDETFKQLESRLATLHLPYPAGNAIPTSDTVYGTYRLAQNSMGYQELTIHDCGWDVLEITFVFADRTSTIQAGFRNWITQESNIDPFPNTTHSFAYGWTGKTLHLIQQQLNQPSSREYHFVFGEHSISFTQEAHPALTNAQAETICGEIAIEKGSCER